MCSATNQYSRPKNMFLLSVCLGYVFECVYLCIFLFLVCICSCMTEYVTLIMPVHMCLSSMNVSRTCFQPSWKLLNEPVFLTLHVAFSGSLKQRPGLQLSLVRVCVWPGSLENPHTFLAQGLQATAGVRPVSVSLTVITV